MKKILVLILAAILMAIPMCVESYAADDTNYDDLVAPCYTHISVIRAILSEGILGFVTCTSNGVTFKENVTMEVTCCLQRCTEDTVWEDYKTKTETLNESGTLTIEKNWFAPANYAYRVKTTVKIKSTSGTVLETATLNSNVIYK